MISIKSKGRNDYIVFNTKKIDKYGWSGNDINKCHTHIAGYNCNRKTAKQLRYNCDHNRIPTFSNFALKNVGKRNYIRYLESHLRVSDDVEYCNKLQVTINHRKNKQTYYNKKMI